MASITILFPPILYMSAMYK